MTDENDKTKKATIQADNKSVAVGSIAIGGSTGDISIHAGDIGYSVEEVSVLITQITTTFQPKPFDGRCPYKGLDVFDEEDAELFFGREKLVDDLVGRVKGSRTLFVTGPSGSGKSSLVRAGLIPALKQGRIKNSERWLYETMKPGRDPIGEVARVASSLASSTNAEDEIRAKATADETIFARWCEIALKDSREKRAVIFIDQFEEVFTQINKEERLAFLNLLTHAATVENGRVIILFSMRSDFVSNCATFPQLNALLNQQFIQIGSMQPDELVSAIAQPALRVGLRIDPDLVAHIINEMRGEPGALPLMQFALKDLFDSRQEKGGIIALTLGDYLERGGIHKALERHADASFSELDQNEQELARSIFSGLIEIGRGTQDTRRIAQFDELIPASSNEAKVQAVIQKLADARLITTDEKDSSKYTITHEKLIDAWPWLKKLVNENRDAIALQNEIASDAKEWEDHKRDPSYLYSGGRLATAQEKMIAQKLTLSDLAQDFIEQSLSLQDAETKAKETLRRRIAGGLTVGIAFASVLAGFAIIQMIQAQQQSKIALARQLAFQAQSINATNNSKQILADMLAIQSLKLFPNADASSFLMSNNLSARVISIMTHESAVWSVAFSPDGKYVVSGSWDRTARVWEASTGKEVARMNHDGYVMSVAFNPDGKYVVSGSEDGTARVWEASSGKEVARMTHDGYSYVMSVAFSPDGKYVTSGSEDGTVQVLEMATGKEIARMKHNGPVSSVAFSPDGKYVVSVSTDDTAHVWEVASGKEIARMKHNGPVSSVAFSPDGKYVISGSMDGTARMWEAASGKEIARMTHDDQVYSVAFSPDGKYVVSGSRDNTARVWEASTGKEVARMTHDDWVTSVAFSPDGKYVVSASLDRTARVWEAVSGKEIARMTHDNQVMSVAFSPDGKYVVSGSDDGTARIWEAAIVKDIVDWTYDSGAVKSVAFSPDGKYVVSGSDDGTARVWIAESGKEIARMTYDRKVISVAFSPDGKYVVSGSHDTTARVWIAASGKEIARMTHDEWVTSVAFSPDGKYVVSASLDGTIRVWEAVSGKEIARITHNGAVNSVAFSPNGKYLVSGFLDNTDSTVTIQVWKVTNGNRVADTTSTYHVSAGTSMAISPDGKYLASGSYFGTIQVLEVASGKEIARMTHDNQVTSVAFTSDGKYVVSGSADRTARVWQVATGNEIARTTHDNQVTSVAFSSDGRHVVSASVDNTMQVWAWQTKALVANACALMPRNLTRAEWNQYIGDALPYQAVCPNLPIEPESTTTP